jgi:hypothetical protein
MPLLSLISEQNRNPGCFNHIRIPALALLYPFGESHQCRISSPLDNGLYERWETKHQGRREQARSQQKRTFSKSSISTY